MDSLIAERAAAARETTPATASTPTPMSTNKDGPRGTGALEKAPLREVLTFRLGAEEYGIDILRVQEIRRHAPPTRIVDSPLHVKGVVNLRGTIVPVIDLRMVVGCDAAGLGELAVVIVLSVQGRVVGALVDAVSDVVSLTPEQIHPPPDLGASTQAGAIHGIGCLRAENVERTLVLLDIEKVLARAL